MKSIHILCFSILLMIPHLGFSQEKEELADMQFRTKRFTESEICFLMDSGDIAILDFSVVKGKPARTINIITQSDSSSIFFTEFSSSLNTQIPIEVNDSICFRFYNKHFFGASYQTKFSKIPCPIPPEYDTIYQHDTIPILVHDTTAIEVLDVTLPLNPNLDISHSPFESYYIELPEDSTIQYWAYWIGVSKAMSDEYEEMKNLIPAEWAPNGESPLTLLGMGKDVLLPLLLDKNNLEFKFSKKDSFRYFINQKNNPFNQKIRNESAASNFGVISLEDISEKKIYLNFLNKNKTIGTDIRLIVSAFSITKKWEQEIKTEIKVELKEKN